MKQAKFEIADLMGIVMTFVVAGIGLIYGLNVMEDVRNDTVNKDCITGYTFNTSQFNKDQSLTCYNTTNHSAPILTLNQTQSYTTGQEVVTGVGKFGTKFGLLITVVIAAMIIGILIRYLWVRFS